MSTFELTVLRSIALKALDTLRTRYVPGPDVQGYCNKIEAYATAQDEKIKELSIQLAQSEQRRLVALRLTHDVMDSDGAHEALGRAR